MCFKIKKNINVRRSPMRLRVPASLITIVEKKETTSNSRHSPSSSSAADSLDSDSGSDCDSATRSDLYPAGRLGHRSCSSTRCGSRLCSGCGLEPHCVYRTALRALTRLDCARSTVTGSEGRWIGEGSATWTAGGIVRRAIGCACGRARALEMALVVVVVVTEEWQCEGKGVW